MGLHTLVTESGLAALLTPTKSNAILLAGALSGTLLLYLLCVGIYNRYLHPLKDIPGPFWASVNTFWLYRSIQASRWQNYHLPIHKKYGPIVRTAPNHIEVAAPEAIEIIYGPKNDFPKSNFYRPFDSGLSKTPDSFSCMDNAVHDRRRRAVAPFYTQAAVLEYEPRVDRLIGLVHDRVAKVADTGEVTDMALLFQKYTFDVIGEIFYGRENGFGFLRDNIDYNNWGKLMDVLTRPITATSYAPYGFKTANRLLQMFDPETRAGVFGFFEVIRQAKQTLKERLNELAAGEKKNTDDVLGKLVNLAQTGEGSKYNFTLDDVMTEIFAVIFAGADTTSTALTAIFYYLHKRPESLAKLKAEVDEAFDSGKLSMPIRFADANRLPYLRAVVNEAMRIHPSTGLSLPRTVPRGGTHICGKYLPEGTEVAMNAAVVQLDKGIYGEDAEEFNPDRWIDGSRSPANMERHFLQFGYGKKICLGKHISHTEMYKLIPTLLRVYDFEVLGEWTVKKEWFQHQKNVNVKVTMRKLGP